MAKKKQKLKSVPKTPKVYEFKVSLDETAPLVWRTFLAHEVIDLTELHVLIQMTMGWDDTHLYEFQIDGESYTDSDSADEMNMKEAEGVLLCDVLGDAKSFKYIYDFGDDWSHEVEIVKILENDPRMIYPVCIGGENACPPEDCGGPHGFAEFKKAISGKEGPEKNEMLAWVGGFYNPTSFDPNMINRLLLWPDL